MRKGKGKEKCILYDIADDFRKDKFAKENFTYKHLSERIKFYVEEDFTYRITSIPMTSSEGDCRYDRTFLCDYDALWRGSPRRGYCGEENEKEYFLLFNPIVVGELPLRRRYGSSYT